MKTEDGESNADSTKKEKPDYMEVFLADANGIIASKVGNDEEVIDGESSFQNAMDDINSNSKTIYYTCQYCSLLFNHPKRFLIHYKWHELHLANVKAPPEAVKKKKKYHPKKLLLNKEEQAERDARKWENKKCEFCVDVFLPNVQVFQEHYDTVHKINGMFKCPFCERIYKNKHVWIRHALTHGEKNLTCPHCPKVFAVKQHQEAHIRTHSEPKDKDKFCSICGRGFHEMKNLRKHEKTHKNERNHQCPICFQMYTSNGVLTKHIKVVHTENRNFHCDEDGCDESFTTVYLKTCHMRQQHGIYPSGERKTFSCKHCDVVLKTEYQLKIHRKSHRVNLDSS